MAKLCDGVNGQFNTSAIALGQIALVYFNLEM